GRRIDGNNLLEVYHTIQELADDIRQNPRPVLLECMTFRMRGHEEASGIKYVPPHLFDEWKVNDPLENYEQFLLSENVLQASLISGIRQGFSAIMDSEIEKAFAEPDIIPDAETELNDVYKPYQYKVQSPATSTTKRYIDAISDGLR